MPERLIDAFNHHDVEALIALMADEGTWDVVPLRRTHPEAAGGLTGPLQFIRSISSDYRLALAELHLGEGVCTLEWELSGTNDGDYEPLGLPASGKPFQLKGVTILVIQDNKIRAARSYYDLWGLFTQIGLPQAGPFAWPIEAWMMEREQAKPAPIE